MNLKSFSYQKQIRNFRNFKVMILVINSGALTWHLKLINGEGVAFRIDGLFKC